MIDRRLTETEGRVARLLAAGFSEGEIAEALRLSRKTIEWHVARVYSKREGRDGGTATSTEGGTP